MLEKHEVETVAYAGETPWHRLGIKLTGEPSPQEIQRAAKLDWKVKKLPLTYEVGGDRHVSDRCALIRESDGKLLDTVSENWKPVQNDEAFAFFEDFTKASDMTMEVAGSLMGGRRVFALAKVEESFRLARAPEDVTESYLLFTNPHQYGHSVDIRFTPVRVVCMNTLTLALGQRDSAYRVSFNHARGYDKSAALKVLGLATDKLGAYRRQADFLAARRYTGDSLKQYFKEVFQPLTPPRERKDEKPKPPRNYERALLTVDNQPGHEYAPGTWWNAFNAVTYLTDHRIGRGGTRLGTAFYGHGKTRKLKALNLALEYAKAA